MKIYRGAAEIYDIAIDSNTTLSQALMGEDKVVCSVVRDAPLSLAIGDYITVDGRQYRINRPPSVEKKTALEYSHTIEFEGDIYLLLDKIYQQPVTMRGDWSLVGTLEDFVDVLVSNINTINAGWTKGTIPTTERKLMDFDGESCRSVLGRLADEFGMEFVISGKAITFTPFIETATSLQFSHGQGNGLYRLTRENVDSDNTITRGYFWGSSKNIDYNYRLGEYTRLMFVDPTTGTNRIDNFGEFNKVVEKHVVFEDVWPSFTGAVTWKNETDPLIFRCSAIDFDLNLYLIEGQTPKVVFTSGDLSGMQFEMSEYKHVYGETALREITLIPYTDEFGVLWPSATGYKPAVTDEFTFVDIRMPQNYIDDAEAKLAQKAADWMDYYSKLRVKYGLEIDDRYLRQNSISINLGDVVRIIDATLGIDKQIRVTKISKPLSNPYKLRCEIGNLLDEKWEKQVSKKISEALNTAKNASDSTKSGVGSAAYVMDKFFTVTGAVGSEYLLCKYPLASVGSMFMYATSGFAVPSFWDAMPKASTTVYGAVKIGANLSIDANGFLNAEAGDSGVSSWTELSDKPVWLAPTTLAAFEAAHAHTFASLYSKPTTILGYGITDAYTKTNMQTSGAAQLHYDNLTNKPATFAPSAHGHATSEITGLDTALAGKEPSVSSGLASQYYRGDKSWRTLDTLVVPENTNLYHTNARVVGSVLTGYIVGANTALAAADSVLGAFGKVQAQLNAKQASIASGTTSQYWRGDKTWQTLNTTAVAEGANLYWTQGRFDTAFGFKSTANLAEQTNLYFTEGRVQGSIISGYSVGSNAPLAATDSVIAAFGKIQGQLNGKQATIAAGTTAQYRRGDNTWQTLNTAAVAESTNLYYTQARFDSAFTAKSTTDLSEGTNLYFTDARAMAAVTANATKTAGQFYTGTTNPSNTNRLNFDGYFYASKLYSGAVEVVTLTATQTLTNKTLTAPKWASAGYLADANGNELIKFPSTIASAVNEVTVANAATGGAPMISASGGDTNISLALQAKGTGTINLLTESFVRSVKLGIIKGTDQGISFGATGWSRINAAGQLAFFVENAGVTTDTPNMRLDSTGLGIGLTYASEKLDVNGNSATRGQFRILDSSGNIKWSIGFNSSNNDLVLYNATGAKAAVIDQSGNLYQVGDVSIFSTR